jgi:uncharacterized protein YigA (DUF484 family)
MAKRLDQTISGEDVLNFLTQHPDFLIEHGNTDWLFGHSRNDSAVVNLGHIITRRAQDALKRSASVKASIVDITAANHETQQRIHHLALLIVAAASSHELIALVRQTLPPVLDIAAATMVIADHLPLHAHPECVSLNKDYLPKLTGGAEFSLGQPMGLQGEVFRAILPTPPKSVAFAFLPAILPEQDHNMVLALAGHKSSSFTQGHGTDFLQFIAAMIAVGLLARTAERSSATTDHD